MNLLNYFRQMFDDDPVTVSTHDDPALVEQPTSAITSLRNLQADISKSLDRIKRSENMLRLVPPATSHTRTSNLNSDAEFEEPLSAVTSRDPSQITDSQFRAIVNIQRDLLVDYCDFFMWVDHPAADEGVRGLALDSAIPARLQHFMAGFFSILQHLPQEYRNHFFRTACSFLLYDVGPTFKSLWMECIGDLQRVAYTQFSSEHLEN
ncbi:Putative protein of unknown function [Podospora comata]|uniref:Uncharacterized protein n=1 Tax=Podospora comata TaxID=48703 RepID=A0ABY6SG91_PODCO|nr:Putative protein of unknown function [Podospora comata]